MIRFARSVPLSRSLNTVAFVGNSFYSTRGTRSEALQYCTQTVSGTVCLVFRYLFRIKYSAFCARCSEFLKLISIFAIIGKKLMQVKRDPTYLSRKITTDERYKRHIANVSITPVIIISGLQIPTYLSAFPIKHEKLITKKN